MLIAPAVRKWRLPVGLTLNHFLAARELTNACVLPAPERSRCGCVYDAS